MDRSGKLSVLWDCGYYSAIFGHTHEDIVRLSDEIIDAIYAMHMHRISLWKEWRATGIIGQDEWNASKEGVAWNEKNNRLTAIVWDLLAPIIAARRGA